MRRAAKSAIVLLAAVPLLQACFGGGGPPRPVQADCARLQPLVTASDGSLSRTQMDEWLIAKYAKADLDRSGDLTMAEATPINDELRKQVGASPVMDFDGDARVNYQEFASGWKTMFDLCARGGDVVVRSDMERSPVRASPPAAASPAKP